MNMTATSKLLRNAVCALVNEISRPLSALAIISEEPRMIPFTNIFPFKFVILSIVSQYPLLTPADIISARTILSQFLRSCLFTLRFLSALRYSVEVCRSLDVASSA